jgi:hypothetical protein
VSLPVSFRPFGGSAQGVNRAGFDTSGTKRAFELADSTRLAPTVPLKGRKPAKSAYPFGANGAFGAAGIADIQRI